MEKIRMAMLNEMVEQIQLLTWEIENRFDEREQEYVRGTLNGLMKAILMVAKADDDCDWEAITWDGLGVYVNGSQEAIVRV